MVLGLLHDERQQELLQGVAQNTSLIQLADKVEEIRDNSKRVATTRLQVLYMYMVHLQYM